MALDNTRITKTLTGRFQVKEHYSQNIIGYADTRKDAENISRTNPFVGWTPYFLVSHLTDKP